MNIVCTYDYTDRFGTLIYQTVRLQPKDFRQRRPDGNGGYVWNLDGVTRLPYRLPQIISSVPEPIYVVEGEKDADTLAGFGLVATTAGGADTNWTPEMVVWLRERDVNVLVDNDPQGLLRGQKNLEAFYGVAKSVKLVWFSELPAHGDVSDWFDAGHTLEEFTAIVAVTPEWNPPQEVRSLGDGPGDWADPLPLQPELPNVPTFDVGNLPESFRPLVEEIALTMQTPADYPACAAIVSLAGCIGHRAVVQPKALDATWTEVCNLWGMNIGPPGIMKSPILKLVTRPLERIQREWNEQQEADEEVYERLKKEIELEQAVWEQSFKSALKNQKPTPARPDDTLWKPGERRLLTTDVTFEKLHEIQSRNPAGIYQVRDELVGFFAGLEREGREGERQYWLQCWNGDGGFTVDRIGRGSIYVPYVCCSLFGNAVPARLRYYLNSVLTGGPGDDGLLPRFQVVTWPDTPKDWKYIDRIGSATAAISAEFVYRTLTRLSGNYPLRLQFNQAGQELFKHWLTDLELKIRSETLGPVLTSHISKFRKLVPVLAACFELSDCAVHGDLDAKAVDQPSYLEAARRHIRIEEDVAPSPASESTLISEINTQRAIKLSDYFAAHAQRVYSCIITPGVRASHALAKHLKHGDLEEQFSSRDISRRCWSELGTPELITAALEHLSELHWVRPVEAPPSPKGGRPSERWEVNPKVKS